MFGADFVDAFAEQIIVVCRPLSRLHFLALRFMLCSVEHVTAPSGSRVEMVELIYFVALPFQQTDGGDFVGGNAVECANEARAVREAERVVPHLFGSRCFLAHGRSCGWRIS